jgi:GNAT superfamily N-acetyltransferase
MLDKQTHSITVREARVEDFRTLTKLAEEYHKEHWFGEHSDFDYEFCHENFKAYCIGIQANVLYAHEDGEAVGFSVAFLVPLHWTKQLRCTVSYNYIKPKYRKQGVMDQFIEKHEAWARKHKCIDMNTGDKIGTDSYKVLQYEE